MMVKEMNLKLFKEKENWIISSVSLFFSFFYSLLDYLKKLKFGEKSKDGEPKRT